MRILQSALHREEISNLLNRRFQFQNPGQAELTSKIAGIIAEVSERGDEALFDFTLKFDKVTINSQTLRVSELELETARKTVPEDFLTAIRAARDNILAFHRKQLPKDWLDIKEEGMVLGQRYQPVEAAGLYVPGGTAGSTPLVSTVLMNALPARTAGVQRIIICTPPNGNGAVNPYLLAVAWECNITEIYKVGGAQAIAAMALGTGSIKPVDVIVGPGNQFVTEAKRQVYGRVGIDMLAGPSEILVIADEHNNPAFVAADLLSQAEHGPKGETGSFLLTPSKSFAEAVLQEVNSQLARLSRKEIAVGSLEQAGAIIVTSNIDEAIELANFAAPEHLELLVTEPWNYLGRIKHAGAVFIGPYSTEPIGDYVAGTNHVLPTAGAARFASGLNVDHFMKKTSIISYNQAGINKYGPAAIAIAEVEGLDAHANAVKMRLDSQK